MLTGLLDQQIIFLCSYGASVALFTLLQQMHVLCMSVTSLCILQLPPTEQNMLGVARLTYNSKLTIKIDLDFWLRFTEGVELEC